MRTDAQLATRLTACFALLTCCGCTVHAPSAADQPSVENGKTVEENPVPTDPTSSASTTELATLGAGCFWCVEAIFQQLEGVVKVESGYSGGRVVNPTYRQVCTEDTGHAEVCQVTFDPTKITFDKLLEVFWQTHDPTTPNQQGNDVGPQYRSAIFFHNEQQRELAEKYKRELDAAGVFRRPIVTEITAYKNFYKAEDYHQNYYRDNPNEGYCRVIIQPKVEKFRKVFADQLKER